MSKKKLDTIRIFVYTTICKEKTCEMCKYALQVVFFVNKQKEQNNNDALSHIVEMSLLFDFYGPLLKENKRVIFEDYVLNDYSLSEIASMQGMSRQGVHDTVKRCSRELERYEDSLHLLDKFRKTKERVNEIHAIAMEVRETKNVEDITKIECLSNEILDML